MRKIWYINYLPSHILSHVGLNEQVKVSTVRKMTLSLDCVSSTPIIYTTSSEDIFHFPLESNLGNIVANHG